METYLQYKYKNMERKKFVLSTIKLVLYRKRHVICIIVGYTSNAMGTEILDVM
jgi:hypothetical protein